MIILYVFVQRTLARSDKQTSSTTAVSIIFHHYTILRLSLPITIHHCPSLHVYTYNLRAAAPAADPGVHVRDGKQLQRHKLDIIGADMLDLFQLDEGFEESYTEVV